MIADSDERQTGQRIWRLRKQHQRVDAEISDRGVSVDLRLLLNGELSYERRFGARDEALQEAAGRRAELEREGWTAHW